MASQAPVLGGKSSPALSKGSSSCDALPARLLPLHQGAEQRLAIKGPGS